MPIEGVLVSTRPDSDTATLYASYWVGVTLRILESLGKRVIDLQGEYANKSELLNALDSWNPLLFWGVGHGNETQFAGQNTIIMLEKDIDESYFVNRVIHLTSCLTGAFGGLLDSMVKSGATSAIGYSVELVVGIDTPNFPVDDPMNKATQSFLEPDCQIEVSLAKGKTLAEAFVDSDDKSNEWIEYWRASGHPDADVIIWALISNRDNKVLYGLPQVSEPVITAEVMHPLTAAASIASLLSLSLVIIRW